MVNRFGKYKKEENFIKQIVGNAKFSTGNIDERYTLVGDLGGYDQFSTFTLVEEKETDLIFSFGRGISKIYLQDSKGNNICLEGNIKKMEKLFSITADKKTNKLNEILLSSIEDEVPLREVQIAGPQGSHGYAGADGKDGQDGEKGLRGEQGVHGEQGVQGEQGIYGEKGVQGEQGEQGFLGEQGVQGEQGFLGEQGVQGEQGIYGEKGQDGKQGHRGEQGQQGSLGPQGERGFLGEQGPQGEKGDAGLHGPQGEKGDAGPHGRQGERGFLGEQGPQGEKGEDAESPIVAATSPLVYDKKKNTLVLDPKWIQQIPVGQVGGAVIGGGGSNTGVRKDGVLLSPAPQYINFVGDQIVATRDKQTINVSLKEGIDSFMLQSSIDDISSAAHQTIYTTGGPAEIGIMRINTVTPLNVILREPVADGNLYEWDMNITTITPGKGIGLYEATVESEKIVATEESLTNLRDNMPLDGGTF